MSWKKTVKMNNKQWTQDWTLCCACWQHCSYTCHQYIECITISHVRTTRDSKAYMVCLKGQCDGEHHIRHRTNIASNLWDFSLEITRCPLYFHVTASSFQTIHTFFLRFSIGKCLIKLKTMNNVGIFYQSFMQKLSVKRKCTLIPVIVLHGKTAWETFWGETCMSLKL